MNQTPLLLQVDACDGMWPGLGKAASHTVQADTSATTGTHARHFCHSQVVCELRGRGQSLVNLIDEVVQKEAPNRQMQISFRKEVKTINREHFLKVEKLYEKHTGAQDPDKKLFLLRLFCMLMRYESIGGAGYQAAIPPNPKP